MDLLYRIPSFDNIEKAKVFFDLLIKERDNNYFYAKKEIFKKQQKSDKIFFLYDGYIIAQAAFTGMRKRDIIRDPEFTYGHELKNIKIINSNNRLDTKKYIFMDSKYIDSVELYDEVKHLLIENKNDLVEDIETICDEANIDTETQSTILTRIGQGKFRDNLIEYWDGCSVTNCKLTEVLVASHIKPWKYSTDTERLDVYNGLLLLATIDKLFDKGYISFDNKGSIIISSLIEDYEVLGINEDMNIEVKKEHKKYLNFHRENIFIK